MHNLKSRMRKLLETRLQGYLPLRSTNEVPELFLVSWFVVGEECCNREDHGFSG
jgi:hypothetical protein